MATVEPWRLEQRSATTRARALTPAQARALLALARIGHPATSADVAAAIGDGCTTMGAAQALRGLEAAGLVRGVLGADVTRGIRDGQGWSVDRKSTRLNSSHVEISYAVFCLKKKKT